MTFEHAEQSKDLENGSLLTYLGRSFGDPSYFESALQKFQQAFIVNPRQDPSFFWYWGEAWIQLASHSGELTDFQQGLAKFFMAYQLGVRIPLFLLDYAEGLSLFASLNGNPDHTEEALSHLRSILNSFSQTAPEDLVLYESSWQRYAEVMKLRYLLTRNKAHFEEADKAICEAILATPQNSSLWLEWAELYLEEGRVWRDVKSIEIALDKLTSSKIRECNPIKVTSFLAQGLILYGLFTDKVQPIKDGSIRLKRALALEPDHEQLHVTQALAELALGLYFSEDSHFVKAVELLKTVDDATAILPLHLLFQVYLSWGLEKEDLKLMQEALKVIERICTLRPYCPLHLNEWGVSLLRLRQFDCTEEQELALIESAILQFTRAAELSIEGETLYNLGCALDLLGEITGEEEDYAQAVDLLARAYEKRPHEKHLRYRFALALSHYGEAIRAIDPLMQASELLYKVAQEEPEDESLWSDLGYTLLLLSDLLHDTHFPKESEDFRRRAEKALVTAASLGDGPANYHLGCLYSLAGIFSHSLLYLKKAADVGCLPHKLDLMHDHWLDGVRETAEFHDFLMLQDDSDE